MAAKNYKVKEIYYTLQGEGFHTGRAAVFCRFSGCNLWSGREVDRAKAICKFCDTNFWGTDGEEGGSYTADELAYKIQSIWTGNGGNKNPFVVCTGGEPLLQMDKKLIDTLHKQSIEIAIETNGTFSAPEGIDWICMSPKANTSIIQNTGNEIKCVYPQEGINPKDFENMNFEHFYIQPMDNDQLAQNTKSAINFCKENPKWNLSIQTHKLLNIP
jgi:7-carboxy-7-deazaguanine synthase (Cx14CxxC type)